MNLVLLLVLIHIVNSKMNDRALDVLLVDDIQDFANAKYTQKELHYLIDHLYESNKQLVFSCDRPISDLKYYSDRLLSRFNRGIIVDLLPPNYEARVIILQKKTEYANVDISDEAFSYIVGNITNNIRSFEAVLTKLVAYSNLVDKDITIDVVRKQLKSLERKVH